MKVCDRCRKPIAKGSSLILQKQNFEVCDECTSKIIAWLKQPTKKGFLSTLLEQ